MSETQQAQAVPAAPAAPKLSLLQQLIQQRDAFVQQQMALQNQVQQIIGAIFACNHFIGKIEKDAKEQMEALAEKAREEAAQKVEGCVGFLKPAENQGAINDGQVNSETAKQVAKK